MVNNQGKTDSPTGVEADLWAQELDKNKELNEKMEEMQAQLRIMEAQLRARGIVPGAPDAGGADL